MTCFTQSDFVPGVLFFLSLNPVISPIRGDVSYIHQLFLKEKNLDLSLAEKVKCLSGFLSYLLAINEVGGGLEFDKKLSPKTIGDTSHFLLPRLLAINIPKLVILREFLTKEVTRDVVRFEQTPVSESESDTDTLLRILGETSLYSRIEVENGSDIQFPRDTHPDYLLLEELLQAPTAKRQLSKIRAKMTTQPKPFYHICSERNHIQIISNLISGSKASQGDKILIDKIQKLVDGNSPKDVRACCQTKIHFVPIVHKQTDTTLGDCSYLDTCHKQSQCRYVHYLTLNPPAKKVEELDKLPQLGFEYTMGDCFTEHTRKTLPAQWINCDVRYFPFSVIGKFAAIISDPAWEVRMNLPYGTCKDFELLELPINVLQDEGIILLWVTGRSIEIGRQALAKWGYKISDEVIWVKLNQLKRTIVTGRTGHWLNHSKEHLLVGIKGNPQWINKMMDIDIVVSNSRQTLRKPDEIYDIVERIVGKHSRKLEIFGRDHNVRPGWLSTYHREIGVGIY